MNIQINEKELRYLQKIVMSDFFRMEKLCDHGIAYGVEMVLPDAQLASNILYELDNAE